MMPLRLLFESNLGAGKKAHCHVWFSNCGEAPSAGVAKPHRYQIVSNSCRSRRYAMQTVIAHYRSSSSTNRRNGCPATESISDSRGDLMVRTVLVSSHE